MNSQRMHRGIIQYAGLLAVLVALVTVFGLSSRNFLQQTTLMMIANRIPVLTFVAVGMTLVLTCGRIDLSVGSQLALCSAIVGVLMEHHSWPMWCAVAPCLLTGVACGFCNGVVTAGLRIPSFIVTLGMLEIARGSTLAVTDSEIIYLGSTVEAFGAPLPGITLSPAFLTAVAVVVAGQFMLTRTVVGRYWVAIGTNEEAVRMSGIRAWPYVIGVFVTSGLLCGLAGLTQTSRLASADPNAAVGMELSAIAACVIGGTSLMGGRGSVIGSFFGVLIIAVLESGLFQLGASDASKQIITGCVIVVAVLLDAVRSRWGKTNE